MTPAISIIMPMYNTEKYISDCLNSLLAQTFQDFEVIIVDDCSTDNSCTIVNNYKPNFSGRLKLIRSKKNSGSPGIPRNKGIEFARGKYLYFLDSDDALTNTALEELYTAAENFQADIVHCEKYFRVYDENFTTDATHLTSDAVITTDFVTAPTFMTDDLNERINIFVNQKYDWSTCNHFMRRELVSQNNIQFPDMKIFEDSVFTLKLICLAEKILHVPNVIYIYRKHRNSITTDLELLSYEQMIKLYNNMLLRGITVLEKFFNERKFFGEESLNKFLVYKFFVDSHMASLMDSYRQVPLNKIDKIIRQDLKMIDDKTTLTAFFFEYMNLLGIELAQFRQQFLAMASALSQEQEKNNSLLEVIKKQNALINYQCVQIQNLKSVLETPQVSMNGGETL